MSNQNESSSVQRAGSVVLVGISENASQAQIEESAWKSFATLHPHEAHAAYPERFWQLFQEVAPGLSREDMEAMLHATEREAPQNAELCRRETDGGLNAGKGNDGKL